MEMYERSGERRELVCDLGEEDGFDRHAAGMLLNNSLPCLAGLKVEGEAEAPRLVFDVDGLVSLEEALRGRGNREKLISLLSGMAAALSSAQSLMIRPGAVICERRFIYVDPADWTPRMVCLPVSAAEEDPGLGGLLRSVVTDIRPEMNEDHRYLAEMLTILNSGRRIKAPSLERIAARLAAFGTEAGSRQPYGRAEAGERGTPELTAHNAPGLPAHAISRHEAHEVPGRAVQRGTDGRDLRMSLRELLEDLNPERTKEYLRGLARALREGD